MALAMDEQVARNAAFVPVALGATTPARAALEIEANCAARRERRMSKPVEVFDGVLKSALLGALL